MPGPRRSWINDGARAPELLAFRVPLITSLGHLVLLSHKPEDGRPRVVAALDRARPVQAD
jgi:hypothetical protein